MESYYHDLNENEKVILVIRRHKWYFIKMLIPTLIFTLVLITGFIYLGWSNYTLILLIAYIIFEFAIFIYYYFLWENDVYVLTNHRIIDIDRNQIFSKRVTEISLDKIQDVTYKVNGALAMMIGYGEVNIQSAGKDLNIAIELAPSPEKLQKQITQAFHNYREYSGMVNYKQGDSIAKDNNNLNSPGV